MGEPAIPLILDLERMQSHSGHWIQALYDITSADPVDVSDYVNTDGYRSSLAEVGRSQWLRLNGRRGLSKHFQPLTVAVLLRCSSTSHFIQLNGHRYAVPVFG